MPYFSRPYHDLSLSILNSCDRGFKKKLFHLVSYQRLGKVTEFKKISSKALRVMDKKPLGVPKDPPGLNRVKASAHPTLKCAQHKLETAGTAIEMHLCYFIVFSL